MRRENLDVYGIYSFILLVVFKRHEFAWWAVRGWVLLGVVTFLSLIWTPVTVLARNCLPAPEFLTAPLLGWVLAVSPDVSLSITWDFLHFERFGQCARLKRRGGNKLVCVVICKVAKCVTSPRMFPCVQCIYCTIHYTPSWDLAFTCIRYWLIPNVYLENVLIRGKCLFGEILYLNW